MKELGEVSYKSAETKCLWSTWPQLYRTIPSPPQSQGASQKREWKSPSQPEVKMDQIETASSGYDRATALVNSGQLWLPAQGLHKAKPVTVLA